MTKQLTTQNATITTAAVEVKTLTISGKQVTLAVFRQLREEALIAEDGTLNGEPWGVVNYHPDKCGTDDHWHAVWQRGPELLRTRVDKTSSFDPDGTRRRVRQEFRTEAAGRFVASQVREWLAGRSDRMPLEESGKYASFYSDEVSLGTEHGFPLQVDLMDFVVEAANARQAVKGAFERLAEARKAFAQPLGRFDRQEWREQELARGTDAVEKARTAMEEASGTLDREIDSWGLSHEELFEDLRTVTQAEADRRQRHRDSRQTVATLPQLFIAV